MKVEDYNSFCTEVIKPYAEQIKTYAKDMGCAQCIRINERRFRKIYVHYQRKRNEIKSNYMMPPVKALDRHKVAACMVYAILRSKVIRVNKQIVHLPNELLMANEYLAVYVGINIVEQYKRDEIGGESKYKLFFPITYHEDDEEKSAFIDNLCKSLYYLKPKIKQMDIFAYSTIFFFIEKYTDTILDFEREKNES